MRKLRSTISKAPFARMMDVICHEMIEEVGELFQSDFPMIFFMDARSLEQFELSS